MASSTAGPVAKAEASSRGVGSNDCADGVEGFAMSAAEDAADVDAGSQAPLLIGRISSKDKNGIRF